MTQPTKVELNAKVVEKVFLKVAVLATLGVSFFTLAVFPFHAAAAVSESSPRALVHLLDYLSQDYAGAVSHGKVVSESEYREQLEFAETALDLGRKLTETKDNPQLQALMTKVHDLILQKGDSETVASVAQDAKALVIKASGLEVAPTQWPSLARGQQVFSQNCVTCHGEKGDGNGPAAGALTPKPANFLDRGRLDAISPFKAFNTIRIGVPGTSMAPLKALSDKDAWAVAFYVISLRHHMDIDKDTSRKIFDEATKNLSLEQVATLSDLKLLGTLGGDETIQKKTLMVLRTHSGDDDFKNSLQTARALLRQATEEYQAGHNDEAVSKALMAYLEGVEPIEPRLKASDPALTSDLEQKMGDVREAIEKRKPVTTVLLAVGAAEQKIDLASLLLNQGAPSAVVTFMIAAAILLREGFEAVLIIIALLGVIRASGSKKAGIWIHGGWALALASGFVAWFFSGWLIVISGAQRELMEGVTSLIAVVVLMYMGFWLHRTTEVGRWKRFLQGKVKGAVDGSNLFGLGFISFMAVFREAFETVLFLRALWLEGGMDTKAALAAGVFGALALIFILSWLLLRYTARIPIKKVFDFSSSLMTVLAVILVGKGLHSLQEMGWISISASPLNVRSDLIGFYPTLETSVAQVFILILALGLWTYGKRPSAATVTSGKESAPI